MAKAKKEKMEANPFKLKKELPRLPGYIIVTLWTAFIFCMIGWIILASLSTTKEIFTGSLLASGLHFENYTKALFTNKAALNLLNSVIYTVPSCILIIVVCAPAAYCMSRFKFRGAGLIQALIIIGLAIPNIMIVMPLFSIVSALNLSGTHFTLIFLYTACSVPYTTFFLLTFFKGISTSFEEAAAIDGCGPIQCFWKIMFPLAQPAIVTVSIFNFIGKWNEYFMALILQQFKQGKIQVIYHDCTFLTKESPSHCSLKRLCEYIPPEMRNRVYCMHFGGDFMSQIKEAGFQVVTSV